MTRHTVTVFPIRQILILICLTILPAALFARDPAPAGPRMLSLQRDPGLFRVTHDALTIFDDPDGKKSVEAVLADLGGFRANAQETPNFGFARGAYWVHIRVTNLEKFEPWYLEVAYPVIDLVSLYVVDSRTGRVLLKKETGDLFPFSVRDIPHRNFIFELPLDYQAPRDILLRLESKSTIVLPLTLATRGKLAEKDHWEQAVYYLFYGVLLVMTFYNLFLFLSLRDPGYLIYVGYILTFIFYMGGLNGITFQYLWPNSIWWNQHFVVFCVAVNPAVGILFAQNFLETKKIVPRFHFFFKVLLVLSLVPAGLTFVDTVLASKIVVPLSLVTYGTFLSVGIWTLIRGYVPARFFLIASSVLIGSIFVHALRIVGVLPGNFFTFNSLQFGMGLQIVLLSLALADRINTIKREKEQAQEEAIALRDQNVQNLQALNKSFSRFVPAELLKFLEKESVAQVKLGDQVQREMTVMFIDIRSFTTLSEKMTPKENFDFLNSYLRRVGPHIRENGGIIDKYIGDAIMALFPGSVEQPIEAAIQIQNTVRNYNRYRIARDFRPISVGIGMHLGTLMVGIIGEHERLEGTVISDSVNISSRLEGLTKYYGAQIIVSGPLLFSLDDVMAYSFRFLGVVQIKGKEEPIAIYEIMDGDEPEVRDLKIKTKAEFEHALDLYIHQEFEGAAKAMDQVLAVNPGDMAADYYLKRCLVLSHRGVAADWKGIDIMDMK